MKIEDIVSGLREINDFVIEGSQREVILAAIEELEKGHHVHYHLAPNHTVKQVGPVVKIDA
jgi:hypothetical protein